ncbi:ABC transporter ATP-binding protein [uncultured Sphaerotilus sp.]|uniref:ABC transporter ATP-binding protein n=1 Tax=uncultured Sphaerotilus sp. TaxID=474984 RepID=UPI0030CA42CE
MLDLVDITKSYPSRLGRRYIFRQFNLSIPAGCNAGLIGPNGAGKSTLMRLLGGLEHLDSGRIVTDRRVSWPIGLAGGFQGSLTGRDNVRFVCRIHAASAEEMREKVAFVQAFAEIGDAFDLPVKSYSSGMRSRLTFGVAMAFDFDLYLIDEITAVGDAAFRKKSQDMLRERLERAQVIYTSHNMGEIARLCNTVVLLRPGQSPVLYEDVQEGIAAYRQLASEPPASARQPEVCPA